MKSIDLISLPGATELMPPDPLGQYLQERGVDGALANTITTLDVNPQVRDYAERLA